MNNYFDEPNIDNAVDSDFPLPHLDPTEQNDIRWVKPDAAFLQIQKDYDMFARDFDYFRNPEVDYLPSIDTVDADNFKEEL